MSLIFNSSPTLVKAYTWYKPSHGNANLYVYYGSPSAAIAEYDTVNHSLKLGVKAVIYASATANGSMYVRAKAQSTGWVTATLRWYIRGISGGGAPPPALYGTWIIVKFVSYDETAGATSEAVLLHEGLGWYDPETWRETNMSISLYSGHYYRFSLFAEAHAHMTGFGAVDVDCGGISIPDSRIEWGYLDVPNTNPPPSGGGCPTLFGMARAMRMRAC